MFWRKGGRATPQEKPENGREDRYGPIQIEPDAERPGTILRVAAELERRGAEVVELFKEIETSAGRAVFPVHLRWQGQDFFVEIETRRWTQASIEKVLASASVLRRSDYADAGLGLLSAYPAPEVVNFFLGKTPAALFQIDLYGRKANSPPELADEFIRAARRWWNTALDYSRGSLPLIEELLTASLQNALDPDWPHEKPPVLGALVESLGAYLGEVVLRNSAAQGTWVSAESWGESFVLELDELVLDPIGKARAFLDNGPEDSVAYYADYVLQELEAAGLSEEQDQS